MNVAELLKELSSARITLTVEGDTLRVDAPKGAMSAAILAQLQACKPRLMQLLQRPASTTLQLVPVPGPRPTVLSFAQQRLWLLDRIGGTSHYHIPGLLAVNGPLDHRALERAFSDLAQRHESLRTGFEIDPDGQPRQFIRQARPVTVPVIDLRTCSAPMQEPSVLERVAAHATAPFDLARDALLRATVFQLDVQRHLLLVVMHHIVADGWSIGILIEEFGKLYAAYTQGEPHPLPSLPLQYADYAHWQRLYLQGPVLQGQLDHWCRQLAGLPATHGLPLDAPRRPAQSFAGATLATAIGAAATHALTALCLSEGATLFMGLHAVFAVLMARHSNERDIVVGSPIANREQPEIAGLIGCFVNTLVLRSNLDGDPAFIDLLRQSKQTLLQAYAHQQVPFELLVERLQPARSLAFSPLFQVMLVLQNNAQSDLRLPGVDLHYLDLPAASAKYDLTLRIQPGSQGLNLAWEYSTDLFEAATIAAFAQRFAILLDSLLAAPHGSVFAASMLSAAERARLLQQCNGTPRAHARALCIHEILERQAQSRPATTAVIHEQQSLSYGELNRRANRLAHFLRALGAGPDQRVAICVERSLEMLIGLLGILKAGAAYVPLDPTYPAERLAFMLRDCAPVLLLTDPVARSALPPLPSTIALLDLVADASQWSTQPDANLPPASTGVTPRHLAYVIYTSGSTGTPKGVMVEHRNVTRLFAATGSWFEFRSSDVWTLFHSFAFDFSVWEIWGALLHGATLIVVPQRTAQSPAEFHALVCAGGVTVLNQTPSAFQALLSAQAAATTAHKLRYVIFGGEALDVAALRPWFAEPRNCGSRLINMYGITETTVHVTCRPLSAADCEQRGSSPIGVCLDDLRLYVLDHLREPVPRGITGEIYVGGAGVTRGYLNQPQLTAERFIASPFVSGDVLYKSGDLARYATGGELEFVGRSDHQVKIRGFRIELGEIEACLRRHPAIGAAVVLVREDTDDKRLVAYYTSPDATEADAEALRKHLGSVLPDHMLPSAFVRVAAWPLTGNGKLDRSALPAPEGGAYAGGQSESPRGSTELRLAKLWCELLGLQHIGRHQQFFAIGGHSLLAFKLISRVNAEFAVALPVAAIFKQPSIAQLAALLAGHGNAGTEQCIVSFREGDPQLDPLLLVHAVGGSALCYADLLRNLDYRGAVWALEQSSSVATAESSHTMQGLAELYAAAWSAQHAERAICLLGWSFGGVLAHEIASALARRGVAVRWLGMIDSHVHLPLQAQQLPTVAVAVLARDLGFEAAELEEWRQSGSDSIDSALHRLLQLGRRRGHLAAVTTLGEIAERHRQIELNLERLLTYEPTPWDGVVHYYRAEDAAASQDDPIARWRSLASHVIVHAVAADHFSIIKGKHAKTLGASIAATLCGASR